MSHLLSLLFAMLFSFGHMAAQKKADTFVPPPEFAGMEEALPVANHELVARHVTTNSYSEVACFSCQTTNATSQPQLILRAQR